ncbi:unnamed protein product [Spirodela intermedia]|uniref:Uncharacterized protein n=1 Tax=Spirodela intermedia TaxID=51605 RepID=A0A7I8IM39_SPIIN|nr:unnamed protein product [Spirodela intermedia]CAA6658905.1 unnamed protein product [Spirodela intermedia]
MAVGGGASFYIPVLCFVSAAVESPMTAGGNQDLDGGRTSAPTRASPATRRRRPWTGRSPAWTSTASFWRHQLSSASSMNSPTSPFFHANTNNFSGTVPDLSRLRFLYEFDISNNRLGGPFPDTVIGLKQVVFLDLRYNGFYGRLPPSVFTLDLDYLFLNNNPFNTPIPKNVGRTAPPSSPSPTTASLAPFPSSIGNASQTLEEVLFLNNRLSVACPTRSASSGEPPWSSSISPTSPLWDGAGLPSASFPPAQPLPLRQLFHRGWPLLPEPHLSGVLNVRNNCIPGLPRQKSPEECAAFFATPPCYCPNIHITYSVVNRRLL